MRTSGLDRALAPVGVPHGTAAYTAFWDHMWRFAKGAHEAWWPHCIRRMWGRSLAPYESMSIEELCALIHIARPDIDEEPTLAYVLIAATLYLKLENAEDDIIRSAIEKVRPAE